MFGTILKSLSLFSDSRMIFLNEDGSILSVNEIIAKRKGYSPSQVVGKNFSCLSPKTPEGEICYQDLLNKAAIKGKVRYKALTTEKGNTKLTSIELEAIRDEQRRVIGYALTL